MKGTYVLKVAPEYAIVTYFPATYWHPQVTMDEWFNRPEEFIAAMSRKGLTYRKEVHTVAGREIVEYTWES